jgi:hypothetical protein
MIALKALTEDIYRGKHIAVRWNIFLNCCGKATTGLVPF